MKRTLLLVALFCSFAGICQEQKKYKLELSEHETAALFYALDKSDAEHNSVVVPLYKALKAQVDEQVKAADSAAKKATTVETKKK